MSLISRDDRGKPRRDASGRGNARNAAMRKRKNPAENRASIVAAAIEEFAARGFKGASMDAIAARTHTTRAMINYYFGSKEKLYLSVLERAYADIREAETKLALDHLSPVDAIRRIVGFTFNYYVHHDGFVRLVVAENQAQGRYLRKSVVMRTLNRPIIDLLSHVIVRGQRDGVFRDGIDAVEIHKTIAALGMFNVTNQYTFGAIFRRDMGARGDVDGRRRVVADVVLSYLTDFSRHAAIEEEETCSSI